MQYSFTDRLKHAWNVFKSRDPTEYRRNNDWQFWSDSEYRPNFNRNVFGSLSDRSIITALKNRISVDAAQVDIQHVRLDDNGRYTETIPSGLNRCLNIEANIDQTGRAFRLDIFMSLLDEGVIAIVPTDTTFDPRITGTYQINEMRVGKIKQWHPKSVTVSVYNEDTGKREDILIPKTVVAIVENPFYAVMNEPNSTFQRLTHKLALLDAVDEQSSSGKLDLIIQLPYVVKTEQRRQQADKRREDIEKQLSGSKYGIAYTDGTERIQQLNRPLENNLLTQIQYLTDLAYSQLGMTPEILNGTADEKTMLNYNNRIIEPIVAAVSDSIKRTFLTKTAITEKQSIEYFRDPFSLVPVNNIADIADKFTRNEILTSNEIRQIIGIKPSSDPNADMLRNKNLYDTTGTVPGSGGQIPVQETEESGPVTEEDYENLLKDLDNLDDQLDEIESSLDDTLKHYADPEKQRQYRKEYYEQYEKEGRLKGYNKGSTKGLNEEGRAYAAYIRELFSNDRKAKVADSKANMTAGIEKSKSEMKTGIEKSKDTRDRKISSLNSTRDQFIESARTGMNSRIESSKSDRDSKVSSINEERDRNIEAERARTKSEIESHKSSMQTKIDTLKEYLSGLSKEDKAAVRDSVKSEIARLREDNAQKRAELQEAFKSTSASLRSEAKNESNEVREEQKKTTDTLRTKFKDASKGARDATKEQSDKLREKHKSNSESLREQHKKTSDELREQHKENTAKAKEEYDNAYAEELEWIKSLPEFQAVSKSKSKSSNKMTRTKYHRVR